eukprot:3023-Heterococcus_DN1.PRE.4
MHAAATLLEWNCYGLQAHVGSGGAVCGFDLMMRATEVTAATPGSTTPLCCTAVALLRCSIKQHTIMCTLYSANNNCVDCTVVYTVHTRIALLHCPHASTQRILKSEALILKPLALLLVSGTFRACACERRFTELDVEDGYMETRGQGYEHFFLAAYAHAQVGGLVLWGWAKETIAPGQAGRGNTRLVNNVW